MLPALVAGARSREERHLVTRGIKNGWVKPKNFLGSIAMVHIEIENCHALGAINGFGVPGRNGSVVKKAKAHRRGHASVMAWGPHNDKGIASLTAHNRVDCCYRPSCAVGDRLKAVRAHHCVRIEIGETL